HPEDHHSRPLLHCDGTVHRGHADLCDRAGVSGDAHRTSDPGLGRRHHHAADADDLFAVFPVAKRGSAMGTFGLVIAFAPAIGPSLSGWIVDHMPWQVLFYMMLPIAIIDLIIAYFMLKNVTERTFPRLDVTSIILSTFGFGGLLF